jgi:TolB-like protein/tetratricopeptide (TPR) repeat protein
LSSADERALSDLAASVADGTAVDWTRAEDLASAADRRLIRHLRLVESIATLHRSIPQEDTISMDGRPHAEPSGPRWGCLVLLERIGEGTSADVYRAWDSELHRDVALKLLHDEGGRNREAHARVLEEARRLARVRHAHVVQVYGAEQHDNRVGLWMELVRGESLEQIVRTRGPFGGHEAALIGLDLCAALAAVHGAGLLHRDVKAQNVMRESGGRLVLMDFGTGEELAGTNRMVGTPLYLAPEIFKGQAASVSSDLYSLGVLLFYLTTGEFPVPAASMEQLARAHSDRQHRPLRDLRPDIPDAFVRVVQRALDSDPSRRYRSAGAMELALRESIDTAPRRAVVAPPKPAGLPRGFLAAAAVLLALVAGLVTWTGMPNRGAVTTSAIRTIAVLPMSELPGSAAPPYFAEGLTDQLIATLGQIGALRVKAGSSMAAFKDRKTPLAEIASKLGVDALVETTLLADAGTASAPGRIRVNARLIEAGSELQIWSQTFERQRGDVFALQSLIAVEIAKALNATMTPNESARLKQVRPTDPLAEEAYLQGRMHLATYGVDSARRALDAFQRATQIDPAHYAAHAGAAAAYIKLGDANAMSQADARASALAEVRTALELRETSAEAHAALGDIRFLYDWDWQGAEREYQRSLEINPSYIYARSHLAQVLAVRARFDEALTHSREAQQMDPQSGEALRSYGLLLYYRKDYRGAADVLRRARDQEPNSAQAYLLLGRTAEAEGRYAEALELTQTAWRLAGDGGARLRGELIRLQAISGARDAARAELAALEQTGTGQGRRARPREVAYIRLALGDESAALDAFEEALDERDPSLIWLGVDPRVNSLRDEARFQAILGKIGLPQ